MKTEPTNIRLSVKTLEKIKLASDLSGKKSAEIMRHAMELGLQRLEAVNYDLDAMLYGGIEAAEKAIDPSNFVSGDPDATDDCDHPPELALLPKPKATAKKQA